MNVFLSIVATCAVHSCFRIENNCPFIRTRNGEKRVFACRNFFIAHHNFFFEFNSRAIACTSSPKAIQRYQAAKYLASTSQGTSVCYLDFTVAKLLRESRFVAFWKTLFSWLLSKYTRRQKA